MKSNRFTFILALAFAAATHPAAAQLSLAPTFVYVDSPERFGSVVVTNSSTQVQEVIIDYAFGYPSADSAGRRFIQYDDPAAEVRYDLSGWIRSFPQRFRVEPGRRQVVRMIVEPPNDLEDGLYWTRMTITASESAPADENRSPGTSARLDFQVKQVIPIVYRKGSPSTGAQVSELVTEATGRGLEVRAVLERDGEAPFFGTAVFKLMDESGARIREISTSSEVYFRSSTHFRLDAGGVPPGVYTAEISLVAKRTDVPTRSLPGMTPVSRQFSIVIPEPAHAVADAE